MRLLIQKVSQAEVKVDQKVIGHIGLGLLIFLGLHRSDSDQEMHYLLSKLISLRIFPDSKENMNLSLEDVGGSVLLVSQFTLCGDCNSGRRPSFSDAMPPQEAKKLYTRWIDELKLKLGDKRVATGQFGALMEVGLVNDGPVTFLLEKTNTR